MFQSTQSTSLPQCKVIKQWTYCVALAVDTLSCSEQAQRLNYDFCLSWVLSMRKWKMKMTMEWTYRMRGIVMTNHKIC